MARAAGDEPWPSLVWLFGALAALAVGASLFWTRLAYEARAPYNVDTPLYWTIGRAILRGYVPYRDLYETKPPGIFLVSAASFLFTNSFVLTHVTQILSIAFVGLAPAELARRTLRARRSVAAAGVDATLKDSAVFVALWALVLVLAAYSATRSDEVQVEIHGLAGLVGYMLFVGVAGRAAFWARTAGLLVAVGMKEPFVLLVPAVFLVLEPRAKRAVADFWGPLFAAGALGAAALLVLGWLPAYLGIYLRSMMGAHIQVHGSPWARMLDAFDMTWTDVRHYSILLPTLLAYCLAVYVTGPVGESDHSPRSSVAQRVQALFLGALLGCMAVGMGGTYYLHHFVFLVPFYLAVIFALMRRVGQGSALEEWVRPGIVVLSLVTAGLAEVPKDLDQRLAQIRGDDAAARETAAIIDAVCDRLGEDRYLWLGPGGFVPYPYTRHVPFGPLFFQQIMFFEGRYSWFVSEFRKRLDETKIVVRREHMTGSLDAEVRQKLARDFMPAPEELFPPGRRPRDPIFIRKGAIAP